MGVFRVQKSRDYTVMGNFHFKERNMSLKAKGLLSLMLSLPDDWDYSVAGLVAMSKDGKGSVMSALKELEELGYLVRTMKQGEGGRFSGCTYDIYEKPCAEEPYAENWNAENWHAENQPQLNTKESNTKESSTKREGGASAPKKRKRFTPPTFEEVQAYCDSRGNHVDVRRFMDYYEAADWTDGKGQKVRNWKQKIISVWERDDSTVSKAKQPAYVPSDDTEWDF